MPNVIEAASQGVDAAYQAATATVNETARFVTATILVVVILLAMFVATCQFMGIAFSPAVPVPPAPSPGAQPELVTAFKDRVESYKQLSDVQMNRFSQMFQSVVVTAFLPILTLILGYMFGKQKE